MTLLLRAKLLTLSGVLLAVGGLAATTPVTLACCGPSPSLIATAQGNGVYLQGSGFTDGVQVRLLVYSQDWTRKWGPTYVTPHYNGQSDGTFNQLMSTAGSGYQGSVWVFADQAGWPTVGPTKLPYPNIPFVFNGAHIDVYGGGNGVTAITVVGSGFDPSTPIAINGFDNQHPYDTLGSWNPIATTSAGDDPGTFNVIVNPIYVRGNVSVIADQVPWKPSREAWAYFTN